MWRIAVAIGLVFARVSAAGAEDRDVFAVCHNGATLGAHTVSATQDGDVRIVETIVDLSVFFGAWRFDSRQVETWRGDRLIGFTSQTDDDGEWHDIAAEPDGDGLLMRGHQHTTVLPAAVAPENFWRPFVRDRAMVFETKKGRPKAIETVMDGRERLSICGANVATTRYVVSGELERTLWYDEDDRLVRIAFLNKGRPFMITRGACPD